MIIDHDVIEAGDLDYLNIKIQTLTERVNLETLFYKGQVHLEKICCMSWHRLSSMKKLNLKHRAQYICQQDMNRMVKYCKTHFVWAVVKYYRNLSPSMLIIMPCQYSMRDDQFIIKSVQQSLAQSFQFSPH